ncbi:hypothetical protein ACIBF5_19515 [Micromonospora sp. NPDC050417]|uniref:hypothetical protein n=1 Tax=Micromonospora sp. NPDC050417 TaxID=3364280 RepID=UPI003799459D
MRRWVNTVTSKVLTQRLWQLERDGLVVHPPLGGSAPSDVRDRRPRPPRGMGHRPALPGHHSALS